MMRGPRTCSIFSLPTPIPKVNPGAAKNIPLYDSPPSPPPSSHRYPFEQMPATKPSHVSNPFLANHKNNSRHIYQVQLSSPTFGLSHHPSPPAPAPPLQPQSPPRLSVQQLQTQPKQKQTSYQQHQQFQHQEQFDFYHCPSLAIEQRETDFTHPQYRMQQQRQQTQPGTPPQSNLQYQFCQDSDVETSNSGVYLHPYSVAANLGVTSIGPNCHNVVASRNTINYSPDLRANPPLSPNMASTAPTAHFDADNPSDPSAARFSIPNHLHLSMNPKTYVAGIPQHTNQLPNTHYPSARSQHHPGYSYAPESVSYENSPVHLPLPPGPAEQSLQRHRHGGSRLEPSDNKLPRLHGSHADDRNLHGGVATLEDPSPAISMKAQSQQQTYQNHTHLHLGQSVLSLGNQQLPPQQFLYPPPPSASASSQSRKPRAYAPNGDRAVDPAFLDFADQWPNNHPGPQSFSAQYNEKAYSTTTSLPVHRKQTAFEYPHVESEVGHTNQHYTRAPLKSAFPHQHQQNQQLQQEHRHHHHQNQQLLQQQQQQQQQQLRKTASQSLMTRTNKPPPLSRTPQEYLPERQRQKSLAAGERQNYLFSPAKEVLNQKRRDPSNATAALCDTSCSRHRHSINHKRQKIYRIPPPTAAYPRQITRTHQQPSLTSRKSKTFHYNSSSDDPALPFSASSLKIDFTKLGVDALLQYHHVFGIEKQLPKARTAAASEIDGTYAAHTTVPESPSSTLSLSASQAVLMTGNRTNLNENATEGWALSAKLAENVQDHYSSMQFEEETEAEALVYFMFTLRHPDIILRPSLKAVRQIMRQLGGSL